MDSSILIIDTLSVLYTKFIEDSNHFVIKIN